MGEEHGQLAAGLRKVLEFLLFDVGLREGRFLLSLDRFDNDFVELVDLACRHANLLRRAGFSRERLIFVAEIAYNQFGASGCIERVVAGAIGDGADAAPLEHDVSAGERLAVFVNNGACDVIGGGPLFGQDLICGRGESVPHTCACCQKDSHKQYLFHLAKKK